MVALVGLGLASSLASTSGQAAAQGLTAPLAPLPVAVEENTEKVALGEKLFLDPRLSHQGRNACVSCHPLDRGAMDGKIRGESAYGSAPLRNTPSLFNVAFNYFYNWDGGATTLEYQTEKALLNPKIMNMKWPELLAFLGAEPEYSRAFSDAYPDGLNRNNVLNALASFERSLVTPNARFDRYLRGEKHALDASEEHGYRLFTVMGCVACHQGINLGGNLFQRFGIFGSSKPDHEDVDAGRYEITRDEGDRGVFRVPSLRNVAVTAPFFHDGRAATLEQAVDIMAQRQLGRVLSPADRDAMVRFLNTLTGEYRGLPEGGERPRVR
ncbi:MAG: c-type cytochrome [Betaproteobacteria bacterium]|nr:c-type cytochrome [Betaproteobacteria bacterium]